MSKLLNNKYFFLLVAFLLLMIVCFYASVTIEDLRTPRVTLASIKEGALEYSYNTVARVEAIADCVIFAEADGVVAKCDLEEMAQVKKGEIILTIGETDIVAPSDGYVIECFSKLGDSVTNGEKVCTFLKSTNMLTVTVTVPKAKGEAFEVGDNVKGKIIRDGAVTSVKGTILVKKLASNYNDFTFTVEFDNTKGKIKFGDIIDLEFTRHSEEYDCVIPKSALFASGTKGVYYVYLATATDNPIEYEIIRYEVAIEDENDLYVAISRNFSKDKHVVTSTTRSLGSHAEVIAE